MSMTQSVSLNKQQTQNRWWLNLLYQLGFCVILLVTSEWLDRSGVWGSLERSGIWLDIGDIWPKLLHQLGFVVILLVAWERLASSGIWERLASTDVLRKLLRRIPFNMSILLLILGKLSHWPKLVRQVGFYIILLVAWQRVADGGILDSYVFAGPIDTGKSLLHLVQNGIFLSAVRTSLTRLITGYVVSIVIGISLGLLIGLNRYTKETLGSLVTGLQALPSVCWIPFAMIWFGLTESAILFVVVMGALFCIIVGVEAGVRNIPPVYLKAARNMGASGLSLAFRVVLPAALPSIITGLRQGWAFAWRSLMAAELFNVAAASLGALLEISRTNLDAPQLFAVMVVILILGILFDMLLFGPLERSVSTRWGFQP
jgi:NitT/TauT family transport system permease protein